MSPRYQAPSNFTPPAAAYARAAASGRSPPVPTAVKHLPPPVRTRPVSSQAVEAWKTIEFPTRMGMDRRPRAPFPALSGYPRPATTTPSAAPGTAAGGFEAASRSGRHGFDHLAQVRVHHRQQHLGFGVAEAHVELEHFRASEVIMRPKYRIPA